MKHVEIYADGACSGNGTPNSVAGYGALLTFSGTECRICGPVEHPNPTNQIAELVAAIKGLEALKEACRVTLYTDSAYVKNGITQWVNNWKRNGWISSTKKPVANREYWERLDYLANHFHYSEFIHIKGHAGIYGNEVADTLAVAGKSMKDHQTTYTKKSSN